MKKNKCYFVKDKSLWVGGVVLISLMMIIGIFLIFYSIIGKMDAKSFTIFILLDVGLIVFIAIGYYFICLFEHLYCVFNDESIEVKSFSHKFRRKFLIYKNILYIKKVKVRGYGNYGPWGLFDVYLIGRSKDYLKSFGDDIWYLKLLQNENVIFIPRSSESEDYFDKLSENNINLEFL